MATHVRRVVKTVEDSDDGLDTIDRAPVAKTNVAERAILFVGGLLITLLAIRLLFALFGANPDNMLADFVYSVTYPFVVPFFGLFGYTVQYGIARFEIETLVAIVVYALITYGLAYLVTLGDSRRNI